MPEYMIGGISVNFPFEPYDVQKVLMEKVIKCLDTSTNGLFESPTGTGKTLSLLCSTLAWISAQNVQCKINPEIATAQKMSKGFKTLEGIPRVIYSSRTHSQLIQAMKELKRTAYSFMKAVCIGSREQLCIHPEVSRETLNSMKIHLCRLRITTRSCSFYNNVEKCKDHPAFTNENVIDIEDLIRVGKKLKTCPYFVSKELIEPANVIFMPYNYLLDPKARKAQNIQLENTIIILDEAHNIEKMCEESVSVQIKSSDITLCIEDVTQAMKALTEGGLNDNEDENKDFTLNDLALLKEMLLELEKAIDEIEVNTDGGVTHKAEFMFNLLEKANIHADNQIIISKLLENLIQFLSVTNYNNNSMFQKGVGLERLLNLFTIVFIGNKEAGDKILNSFKVHIVTEEIKTSTTKNGWTSTKRDGRTKLAKIIHYWCFNPGFCMEQLLQQKVRSIILTSGTLAPLKPLIGELGIPIEHLLENPHIVEKSQVCVKIIPFGPDREMLNSNFRNRNDPKYITSLGRTISTFCPMIPGGLLIFFPSYSLMNKCRDSWQASGIWCQINKHKTIFVEPRDKQTFSAIMIEYYTSIRNSATKGACFMAVCRGKVSEGLDFADNNGRAVIITGLPYPPLKDARVILKRQYLEDNRTQENQLLSGEQWYELEASRAVNQAIGRVIRHKNDYGAILLCDSRFNNFNQKRQLSSWIQEHLKKTQEHTTFGPFVAEVSKFFKNVEKTIISSSACVTGAHSEDDVQSAAIVQKRERDTFQISTNIERRKKFKIVSSISPDVFSSSSELKNSSETDVSVKDAPKQGVTVPTDRTELLKLIKFSICPEFYNNFIKSVITYQRNNDFDEFFNVLKIVFNHPSLHYLLKAVRRFIKDVHKNDFDKHMEQVLSTCN